MDASGERHREFIQSLANEPWTYVQQDGDTVNELLLRNQDDDAGGGRESLLDADECQNSSQDKKTFWWWCRQAWDELLNTDPRSFGICPYVLYAAIAVHVVLHLLAALASLTECNHVHVLLTCLRHFAMAMLSAAAFSCATRFLAMSLIVVSIARKPEVSDLLFRLLVINVAILLAACFACLYEVRAGIMVFKVARRGENLAWDLQLLADTARVLALVGAAVLAASPAVLMALDIRNTFRACVLHCLLKKSQRKLATQKLQEQGHRPDTHPSPRDELGKTGSGICGAMLEWIVDSLYPDGI